MQLCKSPKLSNILNVHDQFHDRWSKKKLNTLTLCYVCCLFSSIKYYMYVTVTCEQPIMDKKLGERNKATEWQTALRASWFECRILNRKSIVKSTENKVWNNIDYNKCKTIISTGRQHSGKKIFLSQKASTSLLLTWTRSVTTLAQVKTFFFFTIWVRENKFVQVWFETFGTAMRKNPKAIYQLECEIPVIKW